MSYQRRATRKGPLQPLGYVSCSRPMKITLPRPDTTRYERGNKKRSVSLQCLSAHRGAAGRRNKEESDGMRLLTEGDGTRQTTSSLLLPDRRKGKRIEKAVFGSELTRTLVRCVGARSPSFARRHKVLQL